ncbi:hypothetical protein [Dactylosporangium sp. NPDC005555]|uniref:hypothetical protein n=1 Tax=Dactylosporangium sp. NPDC005555 TaxID=3154889 RepID=UPI0033AB334D
MIAAAADALSASPADRSEVDGPSWCEPGLTARSGRYPLAVEAPVMAAVDMLMPGVSTVTRYARYYSLYWAVAAHAEVSGLDREGCRRLVRRAEVGMAVVSKEYDDADHALGLTHGVDALARLHPPPGGEFEVADGAGARSYSPRSWGFWSQYNGPSVALGTVEMDGGALRPGRHRCPAQVLAMYAPLFDACERGQGISLPSAELEALRLQQVQTPDLEALRGVFTATVQGQHDPSAWSGDDRTRRATLRVLARCWQLHPQAKTWLEAFVAGVAYGPAARDDSVLGGEERTAAWRGVVLRHHSVGAWRRLWADLVAAVGSGGASRRQLHEWISDRLPGGTVDGFAEDLPPTDLDGDPFPAEDLLRRADMGTATDVAVLLLGARRLNTLTGLARRGFAGQRQTYLDPNWVANLHREFTGRPLAELGRRLVDDMLAQSRRVALRKVTVGPDGTFAVFSRLHERNGMYFADSAEGRDNIGLRIPQLAGIATQVGLLTADPAQPVTGHGRELLELPG